MAGIADLRKEHGGITGALAHDTVCGSSYGAGLGGIGGQSEELGAFVLYRGDALPSAIDDIEVTSQLWQPEQYS